MSQVSIAVAAPTTTTVTITTSDGGAIPVGTEIQVIKVDPEPSEMIADDILGADQPSGYQLLNLPTDSDALYSVNVFPPSGYAATATGTSHGGVNIDVELEALPPTATVAPTETSVPSPTATDEPTATVTETLAPTSSPTATVDDTTPPSTVPPEPTVSPSATVQIVTLPTTGQGDAGSGIGKGILGLLGLAAVFAGLVGWRTRRR